MKSLELKKQISKEYATAVTKSIATLIGIGLMLMFYYFVKSKIIIAAEQGRIAVGAGNDPNTAGVLTVVTCIVAGIVAIVVYYQIKPRLSYIFMSEQELKKFINLKCDAIDRQIRTINIPKDETIAVIKRHTSTLRAQTTLFLENIGKENSDKHLSWYLDILQRKLLELKEVRKSIGYRMFEGRWVKNPSAEEVIKNGCYKTMLPEDRKSPILLTFLRGIVPKLAEAITNNQELIIKGQFQPQNFTVQVIDIADFYEGDALKYLYFFNTELGRLHAEKNEYLAYQEGNALHPA